MVGSLGELCTVTVEPGVKAERVPWTIAIRVSSEQLVPWSLLYILFSSLDSIRFDSYVCSSGRQTRLLRVSVCVVTEL